MREINTKLPWTDITNRVDEVRLTSLNKDIIKKMIKFAYLQTGIEVKDLGTRKRKFVDTNTVLVVTILEGFRDMKLEALGRVFDKHHATIMHYKQSYYNAVCLDKEFSNLYKDLSALCFSEVYGYDEVVSKAMISNDTDDLVDDIRRLSKENVELRDIISRVNNICDV